MSCRIVGIWMCKLVSSRGGRVLFFVLWLIYDVGSVWIIGFKEDNGILFFL